MTHTHTHTHIYYFVEFRDADITAVLDGHVYLLESGHVQTLPDKCQAILLYLEETLKRGRRE